MSAASDELSRDPACSNSDDDSLRDPEWRWLLELMIAEKEGVNGNACEDPLDLNDTDKGQRSPTHWNGWGYEDVRFNVRDGVLFLEEESGTSRYEQFFQGQGHFFPEFGEFAEEVIGIDLDDDPSPPVMFDKSAYAPPLERPEFEAALIYSCSSAAPSAPQVEIRKDAATRLRCSHGHTCQEIYALRKHQPVPWRLPDMVIRVACEAHVQAVVDCALSHGPNVAIIPYGGGTNVSQALKIGKQATNEDESGSQVLLVVIDLRRLSAIKWIDRDNMTACIQAGALGRDIERKLGALGLTMGHEPDSSEFSTLGGWIATKSSGMKKNVYGNIEDIVLNVSLVTPGLGTISRGGKVPSMERVSVGPDITRLAIGSEGTLGIVIDAVVRLRLAPKIRRFESYVFPDFRHGAGAMREIALQRIAPASVRLMDNIQFRMGQALKPPPPGKRGSGKRLRHDLTDKAKKYFITQYHGFDPEKLCVMVLLFEGSDGASVRGNESAVARVCNRFGGVKAGPDSGIRGFFLTYMIAYLRDFGISYGFLSESFETSVRWSDAMVLYERVIERVRSAAREEGVIMEPLVGGRVTQTYDSCATIYFYFGILAQGLVDPSASFSRIEHKAREEILQAGGSLSHHHGVGKIRQGFYDQVTSPGERGILRAVKKVVDPTNLLRIGNLGLANKL